MNGQGSAIAQNADFRVFCAYSARTIPYSLPYSGYDEEYGILPRILRGILEWYSDGLRILCELLENTNGTWYSRTFAEFGALALNLLVFLCVFVRS